MPSSNPIDHPLVSTFGRLVETHSHLERRLGTAMQSEVGLPHVWFEVLIRLARAEEGQLTMSALADQIALTTSGVTRLIDRIQAAGYVERCPCVRDRRIAYAAITDAGHDVLYRAAVGHVRNLRDTFAQFSEDDLATLGNLLDRLRSTT
ncbi:MarR family winged helix-turn-helix transcriptional regulator [Streptomyces sp. NPDC006706]|uniref:MarR family winged helix-turn-helix transcriptional regulator n=1 Tax=Streptomyces sp. NPDC006706 TaxID=3364761 RepID=UPI0036CF2CB7